MRFCELSYEDMLPCKSDYRLILHKPIENRKYYGLKNDSGQIVAYCECTVRRESIHIDCVYVPEQFRGNAYFYSLLLCVLKLYSSSAKYAIAQANDWSIKTFLRAGFNVKGSRKFLRWTAYYVYKEI